MTRAGCRARSTCSRTEHSASAHSMTNSARAGSRRPARCPDSGWCPRSCAVTALRAPAQASRPRVCRGCRPLSGRRDAAKGGTARTGRARHTRGDGLASEQLDQHGEHDEARDQAREGDALRHHMALALHGSSRQSTASPPQCTPIELLCLRLKTEIHHSSAGLRERRPPGGNGSSPAPNRPIGLSWRR